jgi:hypothetical protein
MIYKKSNGNDAKYENFYELFTSSREIRNDLFGSYLAEGEINVEEVQKKVAGKITTYENQLQNLKILNGELKKAVTEQNVQKMLKDVEEMNQEQAKVLLEKLQARFNQ